jgi:uroporphyrinogen decarboxylase
MSGVASPDRVIASRLVQRAHSSRGLPALDFESFWTENETALRDPFSPSCAQMPLGIVMSDECVFDELGIAPQWRRLFNDAEFHAELCRRYNDRAEQVVGRRLIPEELPEEQDPDQPRIGTLADVFGAPVEWREESWSYWLRRSASTEEELSSLLDVVEERLEDLRAVILPADWAEKRERLAAAGKRIPAFRHQRGPVTFAMSVYGEENLVYLILDNPELAGRFRDVLLRAILERARVIDEARGDPPPPGGWSWADDNCALLTPEMYRFFALPIVQAVFTRYAPDPGDRRFQHSDSAMGHLLPVLGTVGLTAVNFGPTLSVTEIRAHLPTAVIHGQLAPLCFSRNQEELIVEQTIRDYRLSRKRRGLVFATAGSVNPGTRLSSLRLVMAAIQQYCRT